MVPGQPSIARSYGRLRILLQQGGGRVQGVWRHGRLEGEVWADNQYGGYEEAVYSAGLRHGPARTFGPCPNRSAHYKVTKS